MRAYDLFGFSAWSNTLTVTVQEPSVMTKTYYAAADTTLFWSDSNSNLANTNYGNDGTLGVGNYYSPGDPFSLYMRYIMFVYFNIAELNGKTIISATLKLKPQSLAPQPDGMYYVLFHCEYLE